MLLSTDLKPAIPCTLRSGPTTAPWFFGSISVVQHGCRNEDAMLFSTTSHTASAPLIDSPRAVSITLHRCIVGVLDIRRRYFRCPCGHRSLSDLTHCGDQKWAGDKLLVNLNRPVPLLRECNTMVLVLVPVAHGGSMLDVFGSPNVVANTESQHMYPTMEESSDYDYRGHALMQNGR
jgi:hypothetical protein